MLGQKYQNSKVVFFTFIGLDETHLFLVKYNRLAMKFYYKKENKIRTYTKYIFLL